MKAESLSLIATADKNNKAPGLGKKNADEAYLRRHLKGRFIMEKLRMGIIGTGGISNDMHYMLAYRDNPKIELYAICDVDPNLLAQRAKEWGVSRAFTDYRDLLALKEIDAVEVIVPHKYHAEITIAALEAGKHVSVQKPWQYPLKNVTK